MYQSLHWHKTFCHVKSICDFPKLSGILEEFGSAEPDHKCKFRNSKNKAQ